VSLDRGLGMLGKMLWEKQSVEKLRLLKDEVPKRTRVIDLRRMCGRRSAISEKVTRKKKEGVEQELPKAGEPEFI
jgi:hypothetical protein